jgi:MFS family permease
LVSAAAVRAALFPIPIITIFWQEQIGMSLADIMLLQAIFGATIVVLEFPSGYVADRLGYRLSLMTGALFWLVGWFVYAIGTTFAAMALAEILLGVGLAFTSGADSALLYVSVKSKGDPVSYPRWEGRMRAAAQISEAISSAVGGWLYALSPRMPLWLQVPVAGAGVAVLAATEEVSAPPAGERLRHLARAWHIVRHALVRHARLRSAIILSVALGISTYVAVWLIQPWMRQRELPIAWFGPLWAVAHLWLAAVSLLSARLGEVLGIELALLICCLVSGAAYLGLGFTPGAAGVVFYLGFMTVRGLQGPLLAGVIQADASPEDRASVLSLNALMFRLMAVVVLPAIGVLADFWGLDAVLKLLGVVTAATTLLAWVVFARSHKT